MCSYHKTHISKKNEEVERTVVKKRFSEIDDMIQFVEQQRWEAPVLVYATNEFEDNRKASKGLTLKSDEELMEQRPDMLKHFGNYEQADELSAHRLKHLENEKGKSGQHACLLLD